MSTLSQFFPAAGGGGGGASCNLIIEATCLWCPAVAGTVLVHAFGGGGCSRRPITDCLSAGGSGGYSQKCIAVSVGDCYCVTVGAHGNPTIVCQVVGTTICICGGGGCCCCCGLAGGGDINYAGCGGGGYYTMQIVGAPFSGSVTRPYGVGGGGRCGTCNCGVFGESISITTNLNARAAGGLNAFPPNASYLKFLDWGNNIGVGGGCCGSLTEMSANILGGAGGCCFPGCPGYGAGATALPSCCNQPGGQGVVFIEYVEVS